MVGVGEELKEGTKESVRSEHIILMSEFSNTKKEREKNQTGIKVYLKIPQ